MSTTPPEPNRAPVATSEDRIRDLIETIPVGLFIVNQADVIEASNPRCREMFRCEYQELAGKNICQLFSVTADGPPVSAELLAEQSAEARELVARRHDQTNFPVDVVVKSMGGTRRMVIVEDVTHRYELKKMRQEFVSMVIHDLRTPLTSISLFLDLLAEHPGVVMPTTLKSNVHTARTSLGRLLNLVKDLLDFEKVEAGELTLRLGLADLGELVQQATMEINAFADDRKISLETSGADADIVLSCDAERIIQVLVNLLSNAVKFSPEGTTIHVAVAESANDVEVSVSDHGRGIPADQLEKIFERYKQASEVDAEKRKGTGLGLSICKTFIEAHGGTIGVESTVGQGSRFWFKLPKPLPQPVL
jgi:PAS domain S-box-containing protein